MPSERFDFTETSYDALALAGVDWRDAIFALHDSRPCQRKFVGPYGLMITARDRTGRWLTIASEESPIYDDRYTVMGGRYLSDDEVAALPPRLLGGSNG